MDLINKLSMFLMQEGKAEVSPLLRSVMKKQTTFTEDELKKLVSVLKKTKTNAKISIAASAPYKEGNGYVTVSTTNDEDVSPVKDALAGAKYKVKNTKEDGDITYIYFAK